MVDFRTGIEGYIRQEARPVEKYGHQPRLYAVTRLIGQSLIYDDDVVFAAVWLHDLGVFAGHRPEDPEELARWDNTAYAMAHTPGLLRNFGFPPEKIAAVVDAIQTHQPSTQPNTLEGEVVRDADILEQLGAVGIMRTVCKIGRDTRFPDFSAAAKSLNNAWTHLPSQLHLPTARQLAAGRIAFLETFLKQLETESAAGLY